MSTNYQQSPAWEAWAPRGEVARRAGGRRRYNAMRRDQAILRQARVIQLFGILPRRRGIQARIARELGVTPATICRDLTAIFGPGLAVALTNPPISFKRSRRRRRK